MSPWGGHGVFPNIYRDMRHPHRYGQAVKTTFTFTVSITFLHKDTVANTSAVRP